MASPHFCGKTNNAIAFTNGFHPPFRRCMHSVCRQPSSMTIIDSAIEPFVNAVEQIHHRRRAQHRRHIGVPAVRVSRLSWSRVLSNTVCSSVPYQGASRGEIAANTVRRLREQFRPSNAADDARQAGQINWRRRRWR
jgi:hypothetical protein